jgi:hypothetical protein
VALELRPSWCLDDETAKELIELGAWTSADGTPALNRDGDHWRPGEPVLLQRQVQLRVDAVDVRRKLGLRPGAVVGIGSRWTCRRTSEAGTHEGGPEPLALTTDVTLDLAIPPHIGGTVELETCLIVRWTTDDRPPHSCPDGAMIWSDGWSVGKPERTLLLEGAELRIPVRSVAFSSYFGQPSGALWAVDLDPSVALDDVLSNVVTVLLNREVLDRDFKNGDEQGDASLLPSASAAGIQVDLLRSLTAALVDELDGNERWQDMEDGTVGALLVRHLAESFGGVQAGLDNYRDDQPVFTRQLWHRFAPTSWRA